MVPDSDGLPARTAGRLLGVLAVLCAVVAAGVVLFPDPLVDAFFAGWVLSAVGLALVGAIAAWTNRTPVVWVAALLLTGLSIVGMWSIGPFVAPAALSLLGAALATQLAGPRDGVREAILAEPPKREDTMRRALLSASAIIVGSGLVYDSAVRGELFSACARETVACTIDNTHWVAVAITVLGLLAIGLGGWLLWKQLYVTRVLASRP